MKKITKSKKLENVNYAIRGKVLEEAERMEKAGFEIIKLNIGNPAVFNFKAPKKIVESMKAGIENSHGYSNSKGLESARKAIIEYYESKNVHGLTPDDVYLGNGVSELIQMTMQALLDEGDEMLVPAPDYPLWTASVNLAGGTAVHYICDERNEWYPDLDDIKRKITNRTKGIVIINPNNPTGALYPREVLEQIAQVTRENGLIIFADEIYDRLVFDNLEHVSIASLTGNVPVVTFSGLSKSHVICGYRVGWMCISGDKECISDYIDGLNLLSSMRLCANVPGQMVVADALKDCEKMKAMLRKGGRLYEQREFVYERLNAIDGVSVVKPKAGFYIFPKVDSEKFGIEDDEEFVLELLKETGVLVVNGSGFNWMEMDHFRVVFLADVKVMERAMEGVERYLKKFEFE